MEHFMGLLIPILAIVLSLGLAMIAVVLDYRRKRSLHELVHKERLAAIEKGIEPPPLPAEYDRRRCRTPHDMLRSGLMLLFLGAALCLALWLTNPIRNTWAWGLLPMAVGVARLLSYRLAPPTESGKDQQPPAG